MSNVRICTFPTVKPTIKVSGFTRIWKQGSANTVVTDGETDEYSSFFEAMAVLSEEDDTLTANLSQIDEIQGNILFCSCCL